MNIQDFKTLTNKIAHPKMSTKYSFVDTGEIVTMFENEGWTIRKIQETKVRSADDAPFAAHQVRLSHGKFSAVGDTIPEIIITNSHNGKKPLKFQMGLFRLACANGLTVPMKDFNESFRVRHMGIEAGAIKSLTEQMNELLPTVGNRVIAMQDAVVGEEQAIEFLRKSTSFRWDSGKYQFNYDDLLQAKRDEDKGMTAWTVFNIAQEKIIGGDVSLNKGQKKRKGQPITNFIRENEINIKLWEAAEEMLLV